MINIPPPIKPFPEYKWRWATVTCTEGLNNPSVYLGVLRTLKRFEGYRPSDENLLVALRIVEAQTRTDVTLARDATRNIIRNSGQYWKALGLLADTRPGILLTDFGRRVAEGDITPTEFAITVVTTLQLPNVLIGEDAAQWGTLRIKPLELILQILAQLKEHNIEQSYITPEELYRIVIPLAGNETPVDVQIYAILSYRLNQLDLESWPDCTPGANDKRMAREFLLFLSHYGFCRLTTIEGRTDERFYLSQIEPIEIQQIERIDEQVVDPIAVYQTVRGIPLTASLDRERRRVQTSSLARPNQAVFRENILRAFNSTCIITGVTLPAVLEAPHIVPFSELGPDSLDNGLCLRVDIHRLFDSGHLRIDVDGNIHLSESALLRNNYFQLPRHINMPDFTSREKIEWRWNYT